jgi:hypothetical protein
LKSEILEVIPDLTTNVSPATYGYPTQYMAYSLLAKMYLNADIIPHTAVQRLHSACDKVISSGRYTLADATNT